MGMFWVFLHLSRIDINKLLVYTREGEDIGLFISLVPKVLLFVGLITLGTFIEFCLVGSLSCVFKRLINNLQKG